jgi:hypothetical protein
VISPKKAIAFRVCSPVNTTRRTILQLSFVMVLVYVRNIVKRMEMARFSVICDPFSTKATARLRGPKWGHTNFLYSFFSAHIVMAS